VAVAPLRPANCGVLAAWSEPFRHRRAGAPLKRIAVTFGEHTVRGEAVITAEGLEGGAIYGISAPLREAILARGEAVLSIDLRPDIAEAELAPHIARGRRKESLSTSLRKTAKLSARNRSPARGRYAQEHSARGAASAGVRPLDQGRSSPPDRHRRDCEGNLDGGRRFVRRNRRQLHAAEAPGVFVAGEMLDWEAPTGGYLLQASFATGFAAAEGAIAWMARNDSASRTRM
jgi:predicted flavoprotein YhiN